MATFWGRNNGGYMSYYKVSDTALYNLLEERKYLYALLIHGVDKWDGYEKAINDESEECRVTEEDFADFEKIEK